MMVTAKPIYKSEIARISKPANMLPINENPQKIKSARIQASCEGEMDMLVMVIQFITEDEQIRMVETKARGLS